MEEGHNPQRRERYPGRWGAWAAGAGVSIFSFALYLKTLAPSVLYYDRPIAFDSAMLQAEAAALGIGHPTGYPTYMMLTHLFTILPGVEPAHGANVASAVYAALAVAALFAVALRLCGNIVAAAVGTLAFALSGTFWSQAVIAEVYTLNVLFLSITTLVLLVWRDTGKDRYLLLAAFLCGLSLTHHLTSGLLIPAGLLFVLAVERRKFLEGWLLLKGIGLFLVGLLSLLYLPIRAFMNASLDETHPTTIGRFMLLVTGWSYAIATPAEKARCAVSPLVSEGFGARIQLFAGHLLGEFAVVLMLIGAVGMIALILADVPVAILLGTLFFGCLIHVGFYLERGIEDFTVFLIPAYALFGVCISIGFGFLMRRVKLFAADHTVLRRISTAILAALAFAIILVGLPGEYARQDRSNDTEGGRTIAAVVRNAGPNATILHHRSPLWYMAVVEKKRQDIKLADPFCTSWTRFDDITWPDPSGASRYGTPDPTGVATARKAAKSGPVYILGREFEQQKVSIERFREAGFLAVPVGDGRLLYELVPIEKRSSSPR
ncbi:MAG: DUF2723 domain-containing protein [Rubrobacter sp.]|nr:DUF2723 domain-containing protein [Rubrobacter sp.]